MPIRVVFNCITPHDSVADFAQQLVPALAAVLALCALMWSNRYRITEISIRVRTVLVRIRFTKVADRTDEL
jgi:hypothetical protein